MSLVASQLVPQAPLLVRESSTQMRRAYQATEALQRVDLVLRYAAPPPALLTQVCLDAFVELAGLGFFADGGLSAGAASAKLVDDEVQGSACIETCALDLSSVSPRGFDWLVQALRSVGAWVAGITTVGDPDVLPVRRPANSIAPAPFGVATRRSGRGFYVRVELDRPATDDDEAAFRTLVTGFRRYALALPSREGHAHSQFTVSPSFERGGTVLGVAGRVQDVASSEIEGPFLAALTRFHHVVAPLRRVEMVLASLLNRGLEQQRQPRRSGDAARSPPSVESSPSQPGSATKTTHGIAHPRTQRYIPIVGASSPATRPGNPCVCGLRGLAASG